MTTASQLNIFLLAKKRQSIQAGPATDFRATAAKHGIEFLS